MLRPALAAVLLVTGGVSARAQGVGAAYGAYSPGTLTLNPGAFAPLQLDQSGNVKIDCVLGCAGTTAGQGAPAAAANAWPVAPVQAGAAVSSSNPLAVTDNTVASALANPLKTVPYGTTGAPTVTVGAIAASTAVLAAEATNVNRLHFVVLDLAPSGGASLYCTDDGSTPTPTSASFIVYAQGFYERDTPAWVPSASINCLPAAGTVNYRAESYP